MQKLNECIAKLKQILPEDSVLIDEPMSKHTTFQIGGPADCFVMPSTVEEAIAVIKIVKEYDVPLTMLGNGSNLLVMDKGIRGIVVNLNERFAKITRDGNFIKAQCGALMVDVSKFAGEASLTGLEFAVGIPGSIGGCIFMNAGADGPTSIYVSSRLLTSNSNIGVGTIALAAYTYMALVPIIQPPIMKALTTKKERSVVMGQLRPVSKVEKLIFPILVTIVISLMVPSAAPLVGMLMFGNLLKESGVCDRLVKTAQNELMNIITIFLGVTVGATTQADKIMNIQFAEVMALGVVAFSLGTACGVLLGKLMYVLSGHKINPLIGSAGVSAVPMAARISQKVGQQEVPTNYLLMHAMGPNVAGVIGSAVAAGVLLTIVR